MPYPKAKPEEPVFSFKGKAQIKGCVMHTNVLSTMRNYDSNSTSLPHNHTYIGLPRPQKE